MINTLKTIFARYGIPEVFRLDNAPQLSSQEFAQFEQKYNIKHVTSSPHFPASNGQAERAVKTLKKLLKKSEDPFQALLAYQATPLPWCGRSPVELLLGRKIHSTLPVSKATLVPEWLYLEEFQRGNETFKQCQKTYYDHRHRVQNLPEIPDNTDVWISPGGSLIAGRTITSAGAPRSYIVQMPTGKIRRNCSQLNIQPSTTADTPPLPKCLNLTTMLTNSKSAVQS